MDIIDWLQTNIFWCEAGVDNATCANVLQARAILAVGLLVAFVIYLVSCKLKRQNNFIDARYREQRLAYRNLLLHYLRLANEEVDKTSNPVYFGGPLDQDDWQNHAMLPPKLQAELAKLLTLIERYNASLNTPAETAPTPAPSLSAIPPSDTPRQSAELKKQLIKCQKLVASVR